MDIKSFFLHDFIRQDEVLHLARITVYSRRDISLHKHDFAEIFWIEDGSGTHLINGQEIKLEPGNLVMIRPDDVHTFTGSKQGLTMMNLAFSIGTLNYLRSRYFPALDRYFWTDDILPFKTSVDLLTTRQISRKAEESFRFRHSLLHLDSLLLFIFRSVAINEGNSVNEQTPPWLYQAIQDFCIPELFKQGYDGFVNRCEKNIDHINRTVRSIFNKSLSDLIAELRMNFAAKQLVITNVPIKTICSDCGFKNLGHFYKTFKKIYNVTPSDFRKINQNVA